MKQKQKQKKKNKIVYKIYQKQIYKLLLKK